MCARGLIRSLLGNGVYIFRIEPKLSVYVAVLLLGCSKPNVNKNTGQRRSTRLLLFSGDSLFVSLSILYI